jgi:hypothetical protein
MRIDFGPVHWCIGTTMASMLLDAGTNQRW